jgi:hypothetical protein
MYYAFIQATKGFLVHATKDNHLREGGRDQGKDSHQRKTQNVHNLALFVNQLNAGYCECWVECTIPSYHVYMCESGGCSTFIHMEKYCLSPVFFKHILLKCQHQQGVALLSMWKSPPQANRAGMGWLRRRYFFFRRSVQCRVLKKLKHCDKITCHDVIESLGLRAIIKEEEVPSMYTTVQEWVFIKQPPKNGR